MKLLTLEDLKDLKTQKEVKDHIVMQYTDYGEAANNDRIQLARNLKHYKVLIAYESVGSWGCDSSSYFLLKKKLSEEFYEVHGSHCSCYGFEGQFTPEKAELAYLKSDKFYFSTGGYDSDDEGNKKAVSHYLSKL